METEVLAVGLGPSELSRLSEVAPEPTPRRARPLLARWDGGLGCRDSSVAKQQDRPSGGDRGLGRVTGRNSALSLVATEDLRA